MIAYNNNTAILFLVFQRPETTRKVFAQIRKVKPKKLYIAADGPRNDEENKLCEEVRSLLLVDWDCEVKTLYRKQNLGCKRALSSAISWFFSNEESGIILEDDCLPSESFFAFCSALLEKYQNDNRITHINGVNFQENEIGEGSYYFSRLTHVWGWAGWRRVWESYDEDLKTLPTFIAKEIIRQLPSHSRFENYWLSSFNATYEGRINTWDYQYAYLNLINNGLCIVPNKNLVSNIGIGAHSTHTSSHPFANLPLSEINEIIHPVFFVPNVEADVYTQSIEHPIISANGNLSVLSRVIKRVQREIKIKK